MECSLFIFKPVSDMTRIICPNLDNKFRWNTFCLFSNLYLCLRLVFLVHSYKVHNVCVNSTWQALQHHWYIDTEAVKVIMMPTLSSLAAHEFAIMTNFGTTSHERVGIITILRFSVKYRRIIVAMGSANEMRLCYATPSLIGWAHTQNDPSNRCAIWHG